MASPFTVAVFDAQTTPQLRAMLGDELQRLVLRTVVPGGCMSMTGKLARRVDLTDPTLGYGYDVRVSDAQGVFWRGRLNRWRGVLNERTEEVEITALQANAGDQTYTSKTFSAGASITSCCSTVRTDLMPAVTAESLSGSGTLTGDLTVAGRRAHDVLDLLTKLASAPLQWGIWPQSLIGGGPSAAYQLVVEARPSSPAYFVDLGEFVGALGYDGAAYANRVRVLYNGGASITTANNTTAQSAQPAGVGLIREADMVEAPDVTDATDAATIASNVLTYRQSLRLLSDGARILSPHAVTDASGRSVPLWRVRAGQVLGIRGVLPGTAPGTYSFDRNALFIAGTEYDCDTGALSLEFESLDSTLEGVLAKLIHATTR